jgi:Carboxypeptidase regulatory-like domain
MRPLRLSALSALLLALLAAAPAGAQTLYGRVTDATDGSPVAAALVTALDGAGAETARTVSRSDGRYELPLAAAGAFRIQVSRVGFRTGISPAVTIGEGERMGVDLGLRPDAVRLEAVEAQSRVTPPFRDARARRFYDRMDRGRGLFYTPEEIARLGRTHTSDLITYKAGVSMVGGRVWVGGNRRGCSPTIYIDGIRKSPAISLDEMIHPTEIWGIEIYPQGLDIPHDLPRDDVGGRCGIIMIWTRHA